MTHLTVADLAAQQEAVILNPLQMQALSLQLFDEITDGSTLIVDASNPFVYALEMGVSSAVASAIAAETLAKRLYPEMATRDEDIYLHMADADYLNRFSKPSIRTWAFILPLQEIYGLARPTNDGSGARQLVIPKHTTINVGDTYYTLQYPIVIKVMFNGTLSIYLDTSIPSPVYSPPTNDLTWIKYQPDTDLEFVIIDVPIQQIKMTSQVMQLISFTGGVRSFTFSDYYHYCRAYIKHPQTGSWVEIHTTHNRQIYDPEQPTVCLTVRADNTLDVYVPQIYYQNGRIRDVLRIDIFTTKGVNTANYNDLRTADFRYNFRDFDNTDLDYWSAPTKALTTFSVNPRGDAIGGSGPISFNEIKRRVTHRSAVTAGLPITTNQLGSSLQDLGFDLITTLDNITQRQYSAVRDLDPPADNSTVTGLACCIQNIEFTLEDVQKSTGIITGKGRYTLPPESLFDASNQTVELISEAKKNELRDLALLNPDSIANLVNQGQYYFTPYHYVFDVTEETLEVRPYHLTSPTVNSRYIKAQNASLGIDIRSEEYTIVPRDDGQGYSLFLKLEANPSLKAFNPDQIYVQLSYTPRGSKRRGFIKGELVTAINPQTGQPYEDNWIYKVDIDSNFDINNKHQLYINNTGYFAELEQLFDITVIVKNHFPTDAILTDIDKIIDTNLIDDYSNLDSFAACTHEQVLIQFGHYLKHLWRRSRSIVKETEYERWEEDVPARYSETIYETDEAGNLKISYDYQTSEIKYTILHEKGELIQDADGNQVYKHRKGDIRLDSNGNPIPLLTADKLSRLVDLFLIDGRYYFATADNSRDYLKKSLDTLTRWITEDIAHHSQRLLERTDLYFHPKNNIGLIDVVVGDNQTVRANAARKLTVTFTLTKDQSMNNEITGNLREIAPTLVDKAIKHLVRVTGGVMTRNGLNNAVKQMLGVNTVLDVDVEGYFLGDHDSMLTTDVTSIPSIGKKLVAQSNMLLAVRDDVTVMFKVLDRGRITELLQRTDQI